MGEGGTLQETAPGPAFHESSGALAAALGLKRGCGRPLPTHLTGSFYLLQSRECGMAEDAERTLTIPDEPFTGTQGRRLNSPPDIPQPGVKHVSADGTKTLKTPPTLRFKMQAGNIPPNGTGEV